MIKEGDQEAFPKEVTFEQGLKWVPVNEEKGTSSIGTVSGNRSTWLRNSRETSVTMTEGRGKGSWKKGGPDPIEPCRTLQY